MLIQVDGGRRTCANTGRRRSSYLEGDEYKEEAVIKQPDERPQSTGKTRLDAVTMVVDCREVETAREVQSQRNAEDQQLHDTHITTNQHTSTELDSLFINRVNEQVTS